MSIRIMNNVWLLSKAHSGELLVMLAIADHAHDDGSGAYPSVKHLARKSRLSERQTQRAIRSLIAKGELEIEYNLGLNGTNVYRILLGGDNLSGVTPMSWGGDTHVAKGVTPTSPKPLKEPSVNHNAVIELIYKAYPRKVGRPKALAAIRNAIKRGAKPDDLLATTSAYADVWSEAREDDQDFIPYPATWFNQERYNDDPSTWRKKRKPKFGRRQCQAEKAATPDKKKIAVPEDFKKWAKQRYPAQAPLINRWKTWADVPNNGLREEWWSQAKAGMSL